MFAGVFILLLLVLALGLVLLWKGRCGTVVGNAPTCAACGFDLTGVDYEQKPCAECGVVLEGEGSVRRGRLEPNRRLILLGGTLCVLVLLPLISFVQLALSGGSWATLAPTSTLIWGVRETNEAAFITELNARRLAGSLTAQEERDAIDAILTRQADRSAPWNPALGAFFEQSQAATAQDWHRYHAGAFRVELAIRDGVSRPGVVDGEVRLLEPRYSGGLVGLSAAARFSIDGESPPVQGPDRTKLSTPGLLVTDFGDYAWTLGHPLMTNEYPTLWFRLGPLGSDRPDEITLLAEVTLARSSQSARVRGLGSTVGAPTHTVSVPLRLVDGDGVCRTHVGEPPIDLSTDAKVSGSFTRPVAGPWTHAAPRVAGGLLVVCDRLPQVLAHQAVVVPPSGEPIELGTFITYASGCLFFDVTGAHRVSSTYDDFGTARLNVTTELDHPLPAGSRLELRPDPVRAGQTIHIDELDMRVIDLGEITP